MDDEKYNWKVREQAGIFLKVMKAKKLTVTEMIETLTLTSDLIVEDMGGKPEDG